MTDHIDDSAEPWRGFSHNAAGDVVLVMSEDDYMRLLVALGMAVGCAARDGDGMTSVNRLLGLTNRLNRGNPHFTPYEVANEPNDYPTP